MNEIEVEAVIVGGGVAGASLAALLARGGIETALIEREAVFRDRVRGESIHPWGYRQAIEIGADEVLREADANPLPIWQSYADREPLEPSRFDDDPENDLPELAVGHVALQNASWRSAERAGVVTLRPATARAIERNGDRWLVTVETAAGERVRVSANLLVGADGRDSFVRRRLGVEITADPEHHRFGGVLVEGCGLETDRIHAVSFEGGIAYLMPQGSGLVRFYVAGSRDLTAPLASDRSAAALVDLVARNLPAGALDGVKAAGPVAFFSNRDTVPRQLTGPDWVLIGDAAGVNDPSIGHGLSMVYRDVRRLWELLEPGRDRQAAIDQYAAERSAYHAVLREVAKWIARLYLETGDDVARRREGVQRAREADPTLGGFAFILTRGPVGLVADEAARRRYFGEDLPPPA